MSKAPDNSHSASSNHGEGTAADHQTPANDATEPATAAPAQVEQTADIQSEANDSTKTAESDQAKQLTPEELANIEAAKQKAIDAIQQYRAAIDQPSSVSDIKEKNRAYNKTIEQYGELIISNPTASEKERVTFVNALIKEALPDLNNSIENPHKHLHQRKKAILNGFAEKALHKLSAMLDKIDEAAAGTTEEEIVALWKSFKKAQSAYMPSPKKKAAKQVKAQYTKVLDTWIRSTLSSIASKLPKKNVYETLQRGKNNRCEPWRAEGAGE